MLCFCVFVVVFVVVVVVVAVVADVDVFSFLFWTDQQINEPTDRQLAQCKIVKISQTGVEVMTFQRRVKNSHESVTWSANLLRPLSRPYLTLPPWQLMTPLPSPGRGFLHD